MIKEIIIYILNPCYALNIFLYISIDDLLKTVSSYEQGEYIKSVTMPNSWTEMTVINARLNITIFSVQLQLNKNI